MDSRSAEAPALIIAALEDENAGVREVAAHALQTFDTPLPSSLTEAARQHAEDPAPAVRAELSLVLGEAGDVLLSRQARSHIPEEAVEALARLPVRALAIAVERADDSNALVRAAALTKLAELANPETLAEIDLTTALSHPEAKLRSAALRVLVRRSKEGACEAIGAFLFDPSAEVRETAISAMIAFGPSASETASRIAGAASARAAEAAFDVLVALESQGPRLLRQHLRNRVERAWCIQLALSEQTSEDSLANEFLHLALGNRFAQDVQAAFEILARLENRATLRHIELELRNGLAENRADALELLSHLGDRQASAALVLLLEGGSLSEKQPQLPGWLRLDHGADTLESIAHESGNRWLELAITNEAKAEFASGIQEARTMERLLGLRGVPLFAHLSLDQLNAIAGHTTVASYVDGERIVKEGELGDSLYVLLQGDVNAIISHGTNHEQIVNHLHAPDCFGELSVLDGSPRSATIVASSDVRLLKLEGTILREILTDVPRLSIDLLRALSKKVRAADERSRRLRREHSEGSVSGSNPRD